MEITLFNGSLTKGRGPILQKGSKLTGKKSQISEKTGGQGNPDPRNFSRKLNPS